MSAVRAVGPRMELYTGGRRRILPPLVFGAGVLWHLLVHGRRYDVVHTASFPYFSLLAARPSCAARTASAWSWTGTRCGRASTGPSISGRAGSVGWWVQRRCVRLPQRAFCFSRLHAQRLLRGGLSRCADRPRG